MRHTKCTRVRKTICETSQDFVIYWFHVTYYFDFYVRLPECLEGKYRSRLWENLENLLMKQICKTSE